MPTENPTQTTRRRVLGLAAVGATSYGMTALAESSTQATTYTLDVVIATTDKYPRNSELVQQETELARYLPEYTTQFFQQNGVNRQYELGRIKYLRNGGEYCTNADVVGIFTKNSVDDADFLIKKKPNCNFHPARVPILNPSGTYEPGENINQEWWGNTFVHEYLHEYGIGFPEQYEFQEHNQDTTGVPPKLPAWNHNQNVIEWDVMSGDEQYRDNLNELNKAILNAHSPTDQMSPNVGVPIHIDVTFNGEPVQDTELTIWKRPLYIGEDNPLTKTGTVTTDADGRAGPLHLDTNFETYHGLMAVKGRVNGIPVGTWVSVYDLRKARYLHNNSRYVRKLAVEGETTPTPEGPTETTTTTETVTFDTPTSTGADGPTETTTTTETVTMAPDTTVETTTYVTPELHHIVIFGGGGSTKLEYTFTITGQISPSNSSGQAPIQDQYVSFNGGNGKYDDSITGNTAHGWVAGGGDAYTFTGEIRQSNWGRCKVYFDGKRIN